MNIRDRISPRQATEIALNAAPLLAALVLGYRQRWVAEDAFISLRVVDNLLNGHGPVFNIGERVEVYTHPLWLLIVTLLGALGIRPEYAAVAMGLALSVAGIAMAQLGAARLTRHILDTAGPRRAITLPVGALMFIAIPVVWDFLTSGMETGLTFAWLGTSFWLLVRRATRIDPPGSERPLPLFEAMIFGLGPLVRPDLGLFSVVFLLALIACEALGHKRKRVLLSTLWLTLSFGSILGIYQIFRMGYFAILVPNTALAKEASSAHWDRGWEYFSDFSGTYHLWVPLVILLAGWLALLAQAGKHGQRAVVAVAAPTIAAMLHALYVIGIGGDFMHGRLLLPALFGFMLPVAAVSLDIPTRAHLRSILMWSGVAVVGIWAISCALLFRWSMNDATVRDGIPHGIVSERQFFVGQTGSSHPLTVEDYRGTDFEWVEHGLALRLMAVSYPRVVLTDLAEHPLGEHIDERVALVAYAWSIGVQSHAAGDDVRLVDRLGLGDPLASRMKVVESGRPGHEKQLPLVWIHARYADVDAIDPIPADLQAALDVLRCGDVAALVRAVDDPMTPRRFAANVRLSWRLTGLRIHPDPIIAREEICDAAPDH